MSITSRTNDYGQLTSRTSLSGSREAFRIKHNPLATFRLHSSIYQDLAKRECIDKPNVIERFQELRRKMAFKKNQRHRRVNVESVTVDLLKQKQESFSFDHELSCSKIIRCINAKAKQMQKVRALKSETQRSKLKTKSFQPYKENKNVRIVYNDGGRVVEYTPEVREQIFLKEGYQLQSQQLQGTLKQTAHNSFQEQQLAAQRNTIRLKKSPHKPQRRRICSVAPDRRKVLQITESFLENIQPWESQQVIQNQNYL